MSQGLNGRSGPITYFLSLMSNPYLGRTELYQWFSLFYTFCTFKYIFIFRACTRTGRRSLKDIDFFVCSLSSLWSDFYVCYIGWPPYTWIISVDVSKAESQNGILYFLILFCHFSCQLPFMPKSTQGTDAETEQNWNEIRRLCQVLEIPEEIFNREQIRARDSATRCSVLVLFVILVSHN